MNEFRSGQKTAFVTETFSQVADNHPSDLGKENKRNGLVSGYMSTHKGERWPE